MFFVPASLCGDSFLFLEERRSSVAPIMSGTDLSARLHGQPEPARAPASPHRDVGDARSGPALVAAALAIPRRLTWWQRALGAALVSRLVSTALWVLVMALARPGSRIGQHTSLIQAMVAWDGQWYQLVARSGYPVHLPVGAEGLVQSNAWAFLPAYPYLADVVALGHPSLWPLSAELLSVLFCFGSAILLALLLRPHVGERGAQRAVWLFVLSPVAFILQAAYAESMGLFLIFAALCLIDRQRYLLALAPTLLLAFTRPGVQALALAVALQLGARWWAGRRSGAPLPAATMIRGLVLLVVAGVSGFAWGWIAAAVTGRPDAYLATELAWRTSWMGQHPFVPGAAWLFAARFWFGPAGPVGFGVLVGGFTALLITSAVRRTGATVWAWTLSWGLYLLAVFFPQSSTFRLMLPFAPAGGALAGIRRSVMVGLLALAVAGQALWLYYCFGGWQHFWTVP
jgi:hypothetical protein